MITVQCEVDACRRTFDGPEGSGRGSAEWKLNLHRKNAHQLGRIDSGGGAVTDEVPPGPVDAAGPFGEAPPGSAEIPPASGGDRSAGGDAAGGRGLFARFRKGTGSHSAGAPPKETRARAPTPRTGRGARVSAAETFADAWGWIGSGFANAGHQPTGRMIRFQAPVAGELLDDVVKGTMVDKALVQRIVGARGKLDQLVAVFGPPLLVWQMEKALAAGNQQALSTAEYMLKGTIRNSLPVMLPALKKVRKREEVSNAALADLLDDDDLAAMGITMVGGKPVNAAGAPVDVADVFVSMLFTDYEPPPQAAPEPQPDGTEEPVL